MSRDHQGEEIEGVAGTDLAYLRGVAFSRRPYRQYTRAWDHDHCSSCMAAFSEDAPGDLHDGWATTPEFERGAEYDWLCDPCFARLREPLGLRVIQDTHPARPFRSAPEVGSSSSKPPRVHG